MNYTGPRIQTNQLINVVTALTLSLFIAFVTYVVLSRLGFMLYFIVLAVLLGVIILFKLSSRDLSFAMILWFFSMSGFQNVARVHMVGLPDVSIDRLLLLWIIFMFMFQILGARNRIKGPFTLDILIIVHAVYIFGSMTITDTSYLPAWVNSSMVPMSAYLYGRHAIKKEKQIRNVFYFFLALSIYYSITAIGEHFKLNALVWPKAILNPEVGHLWHPGRSRGPVMHPPLFGQLQAMLVPVYFFFITRKISIFKTALLGVSFGLSLLGVFLAYTRGPWLAAGVALPMLGLLRPHYRKVLGVVAVIGIIVGTLGLFQLANSDFLQERLDSSNTLDNRLAYFVTSVRIISDHPLFGVGYFNAKNYAWLYNQGGYIPLYGYVSKQSGRNVAAHDIYLGRAADEGLVSIFLLVAIGIVAVKAFARQWRANPQGKWFNRDMLAVMASIAICYLVGGMVIDYRYFDLINVIVYFIMGLIYGYSSEAQPAAAQPRPEST